LIGYLKLNANTLNFLEENIEKKSL
jgi:hypothetical protein